MIYNHSSTNMFELKDNSVHCVITSPPYPMIKKWDSLFESQGIPVINDKNALTVFSEQHALFMPIWEECCRVLIDGGIACINIGDATRTINKNFMCYPNYAYITTYMLSLGFTPLIPIIWKKIANKPNAFMGSGFLPVNAYVTQDCEYIGVYRKGRNRVFSEEEKIIRRASSFTKEERDQWFSQVWEINGKRGAGEDSGWPQTIFYRLMRMYSIKGDTVLDPFCGNGNEAICHAYERNYIGYDIRS